MQNTWAKESEQQVVWQQLVRDVYWLCAHTALLDVLGDVMVDGGRQRQVEETVCLGASGQGLDVCVEFGEGALFYIFPTDVRVSAEEGWQPVCVFICRLGQTGHLHMNGLFKDATYVCVSVVSSGGLDDTWNICNAKIYSVSKKTLGAAITDIYGHLRAAETSCDTVKLAWKSC